MLRNEYKHNMNFKHQCTILSIYGFFHMFFTYFFSYLITANLILE